jgi:hypothetical protein
LLLIIDEIHVNLGFFLERCYAIGKKSGGTDIFGRRAFLKRDSIGIGATEDKRNGHSHSGVPAALSRFKLKVSVEAFLEILEVQGFAKETTGTQPVTKLLIASRGLAGDDEDGN